MIQLYPYQETVKNHIQSRQSVILQAPTGAGKTRASLAPFIEAFFDFKPEQFPKKCIYSVPMRTLANQFEAEYEHLAASYQRVFDRTINVTIQTGERPEDPKLEGDLIFTTIDQTLSNFLCIPYALSTGQANINAGAIVSSYLVFDEFHLFPPEALATTLAILKLLKGITPFLLMTATFSATMLTDLSQQLGAVVIPQPEDRAALQALPSQQKERRYFAVDNLLTAESVIQHHPRGEQSRSIAICNTVQRAQKLFEAINQAKPAGTEVKLLHSRFYKEDRTGKEEWLRREFGKDKSKYQVNSAILVATQVVEVGLDITSSVLHTELAPANAILQRAGRCARYQGESGNVYIYRLPEKENRQGQLELQYAPYKEEKEICQKAWAVFQEQSGQTFTFVDEQNLLSEVHGPADARLLQKLEDSRQAHKEMMQSAMGFQDRGLAAELIRSVNNREVIVHPNPRADVDEKDPTKLKNPWRWQSFSLFAGSVDGAFDRLQELAEEIEHEEWIMMRLVLRKPEGLEEWEKGEEAYDWVPVYDKSQLRGALLVAVHPHLADYDSEIGFQIGVASNKNWCVRERAKKPNRNDRRYTYQQETYLEHIAGLYRAYQQKWWDKKAKKWRLPLSVEMAYAFAQTEQRLGLPTGLFEKVTGYVIAGHDLGKLGQGWQAWVHRWQALIKNEVAPEVMLAHTDYDGSVEHDRLQKKVKKEIGPRPPHAAESAYGLLPVSLALTGNNMHIVRAINTAIACHHTATHQGNVKTFRPAEQAKAALQEAFALIGLGDVSLEPITWSFEENTDLGKYLAEPDKTIHQMLPYLLLARVLRLADQRSQQ
jgi:CRISPR-associated endonuclease/helicase Cas3